MESPGRKDSSTNTRTKGNRTFSFPEGCVSNYGKFSPSFSNVWQYQSGNDVTMTPKAKKEPGDFFQSPAPAKLAKVFAEVENVEETNGTEPSGRFPRLFTGSCCNLIVLQKKLVLLGKRRTRNGNRSLWKKPSPNRLMKVISAEACLS